MARPAYVLYGLSTLWLIGCGPGAKNTKSVEDRLVELEQEHAALQREVAALRADQVALSRDADTAAIERRSVRGQSDDVAARLALLEEARKEPAKPPGPAGADPDARYQTRVGDAHTRGPANALVTIVVYSDFQCPFCGRVRPTLELLEDKYGEDLRLVFKHNPLAFHQRAKPAALAAEAAGRQGKFWQMHDLLFDNAKTLTDEDFLRFAKKLRLNRKRFKRDLRDPELSRKIDAQQAEGAGIGARGTPTFFINGRVLSGARPPEAFSELIDEELAHAQQLVSQGTARADVYDRLMDEARPRL